MDILNTLLEISIFSGVIFIVTMLIKRCFKNKMSPFLHYIVWGLFLLRLMIPVTFDAPLHFFTYETEPLPVAVQSGDTSTDSSFIEYSAPETTNEIALTTSNDQTQNTSQTTAQTESNTSCAPAQIQLTTTQFLLLLWLSGAAIGIVYVATLTAILHRKVKRKSAPPSAHLINLLDDVKAELGIKIKLKLVCQYEYGSPALLFPHTILIPMDALAAMNDEQIKNCLRHECMHLKRSDHVINLIMTLLNAVYWFNPFIWVAFYQMRKDMETACDSAVVKRINASARRDYAVLVLDLCAQPRHMQIALGMAQNKKTAEQRIKGIFMENKSKHSVKLISVTLAAILIICCFTTACQPTPEEAVVVNKNKDLVEEVQSEASPSVIDESHKLRNIELPNEHYTYTSENENASLTINVDAEIVKPEADKMPFARVKPMAFTQEMVTGMFNYLFPDEKPYLPQTQLTKDEIEEQILGYQQMISNGTIDGDPIREDTIEEFNEIISELQKDYETAPVETPELVVSDGTLQIIERSGTTQIENEDGSIEKTEETKTMHSLDVSLDNAFFYIYFYDDDDDPKTYLWYANTTSTFSTDGMVKIDYGETLPDAAKEALNLTLEEAVAKADGFFEAAGIDDVQLFASYIVDNHGTGHVDDNWDPASEYAYELFYTHTVNGVPVSCHMSHGGSLPDGYNEPWGYESIEFTISSDGILEILWRNPCASTEIVEEDTDLIDFETAIDKFENAVTYTYGDYVDSGENVDESIEVNIDSIQLNLVRLREIDTADTKSGLYVPAYVFYGYVKETCIYEDDDYVYEGYKTSRGGGNDFYPGPLMVIAINAIDGSVIDTMLDIY